MTLIIPTKIPFNQARRTGFCERMFVCVCVCRIFSVSLRLFLLFFGIFKNSFAQPKETKKTSITPDRGEYKIPMHFESSQQQTYLIL